MSDLFKRGIAILFLLVMIPLSSAAQFTLNLKEGWNLVSFPLEPVDNAIDPVLNPISGKYEKVVFYNNSDSKYYIYEPGNPASNLHHLDHGMGFWIEMTDAAALTVHGHKPISTNFMLRQGYNLISWPSEKGMSIEELDILLDNEIESVIAYDNGYKTYSSKKLQNSLTIFQPGFSYWIKMKDKIELSIPYSGNILHVGAGYPYTRIQDAVGDSKQGDMIYIHADIYDFSDTDGIDLTGLANLHIAGEGKEQVILQGNHYGTGIILINSENITIEKITVTQGHQGIFIENSENIKIREIISNESTWEGCRISDSGNIDVYGSDFAENGDNGLLILDSHDIRVSRTVCLDNYWNGMAFFDSDSLDVTDTRSYYTKTHHGYFLYNVNNSYFYDMDAGHTNEIGIYLYNSSFNNLTGIYSDKNDNGMYMIESSNNNINGLNAHHGKHGIVIMTNSDYNSMENGNVGLNNDTGLIILDSDNNYIHNMISDNNLRGVYLDYNSNTILSDFAANMNYYGIYIDTNTYNLLIRDSHIEDNIDTGIYDKSNLQLLLDNTIVRSNNNCDIYNMTCYDLTKPAPIYSFYAYPGSGSGSVNLGFTAPGDNPDYGKASQYIVRYSNDHITYDNFDSATEYAGSWQPKSAGEYESIKLDFGPEHYGETYFFAVKAVDDQGNFVISNDDYSIIVYRDIDITYLSCFAEKKPSQECYDATERTIYAYDILVFEGVVENLGNMEEWITTYLTGDAYGSSGDFFEAGEARSVIIYTQVPKPSYPSVQEGNYSFAFEAGDAYYLYSDIPTKVHSIRENVNLSWRFPDTYPDPTESGNKYSPSEQISIYARVNNTHPADTFYELPVYININTSFRINSTYEGMGCSGNICYPDVSPRDYNFVHWKIDPLPAGTYNISIYAGLDSRDRPDPISRIIEVLP